MNLKFTWNIQVSHRVSRCTGDTIPSSSDALDIAKSTPCAGGGATERCHSRGEIVRFRGEDKMRFGAGLFQLTHRTGSDGPKAAVDVAFNRTEIGKIKRPFNDWFVA